MDPDAPHHRLPVRTITINSPRSVMLLNPVLPLVLCLTAIAVVFTIWPQALEHAPISFERRGVIHHIWHYALLGGSLLTLYGMLSANLRRLQLEFTGHVVLIAAMAMNLVAQVSTLFTEGQPAAEEVGVTGLGLALRAAAIAALGIRAYVLVAEPIVHMPSTVVHDEED